MFEKNLFENNEEDILNDPSTFPKKEGDISDAR